MLNKDSDFDCS